MIQPQFLQSSSKRPKTGKLKCTAGAVLSTVLTLYNLTVRSARTQACMFEIDTTKAKASQDGQNARKLMMGCSAGAVLSTVLTLYDAIMSTARTQPLHVSLQKGSDVLVYMLGEPSFI